MSIRFSTPLLCSLLTCGLMFAEDTAPEAQTVEQRLAALEAEVSALRTALADKEFAKSVAAEVVAAQIKAQQPRTPEEAVAIISEEYELDEETQKAVILALTNQDKQRRELMTQMRSGTMDRSEMRAAWSEQREADRTRLDGLLTDEQKAALRQAQRPPAQANNGNNWGNWGGGWNRGNRGGGNNNGGQDRGNRQAPPATDSTKDF